MSNALEVSGLQELVPVIRAGITPDQAFASKFEVSLNEEGIATRDRVLDRATFIDEVTNKTEFALATDAGQDLATFVRSIEKTRKSLKQPLLDAGRLIDATAEEAVKVVKEELDRVGKLCNDFQTAELARERKEREAAEAEARRLQAIIDEAARKERLRLQALETERLRLEQEAISARSKKAREEAAAKAEEISESILETELAADFAEEPEPVVAAPVTEAARVKGSAVKTELDFEVTDKAALFKAYPHLFQPLEVKTSDVRAFVNVKHPTFDVNKIPGLRVFEKTKVSFTSKAKI